MAKNLWDIAKVTTLAIGLCFVVIKPVYASGFALNEQSITYLGNAYAGTSSKAEDASSSYYNPAAMSDLKNSQFVFSGAYIMPRIKIYATSVTGSGGPPRFGISGNNPSTSNKNLTILGGHVAWRISKDFSLGLSVVQPFGMDIVYGPNAIVRLFATTNKITTVDISPTFAYKLHKYLAVGAGIDFLRVNATIASGVAWGPGIIESSGVITNAGSARSIGYHVGLFSKPWRKGQMGLVYFSRFLPNLSGTTASNNQGTLDFPTSTSTFNNARLNLPDRIDYSITQGFAKNWKAMGEVEWTHWSRLKTFFFNYNSTALPGYQSFYFRNTWRFALGADYDFYKKCTLKVGAGYDQSPTTNKFRSASMPDSDRYMLALGLKFVLNKLLTLNAGYAHVFFQNCNIAETGVQTALNPAPSPNFSSLYGSVRKHSDIVGLQVTLNFVK